MNQCPSAIKWGDQIIRCTSSIHDGCEHSRNGEQRWTDLDIAEECQAQLAELEARLLAYEKSAKTPEIAAHHAEALRDTTIAHDELEADNEKLEAQCAAMRGAIQRAYDVHNESVQDHEAYRRHNHVNDLLIGALASDSGKALLERLERLERESDGWKAAMTVHADRAEKAERERDEERANARQAERIYVRDVRPLFKTRAQALEEAAKVAENYPSMHKREIAAAIRALKTEGTT